MASIYYNCGNGLEFELAGFNDGWALTISFIRHLHANHITGSEILIPLPTAEARDQMLKEIQTFAETTIIRLRNAKDEV